MNTRRSPTVVAIAVFVERLPVHVALAEAGLVEELDQLGQRSQAPVVRERLLERRAVGEAKVDVKEDVGRERIGRIGRLFKGSSRSTTRKPARLFSLRAR
jgi:hypothetical protein